MSNILLVGKAGEESENLKLELDKIDIFNVNLASTPEQAISTVTGATIDLLIYNTEILTKKKLALTQELRHLGSEFPVLLLANSIMGDTLSDLDGSNSTVFLEKPFEVKDLFGLSDKLIQGKDVRQRIFRRFLTNQEGTFAKFPKVDPHHSVKIRNLSQGGAYLEYEGSSKLSIGDQLYLAIPLRQIKKEYKMLAKVIWSSPKPLMGRHSLGVEFVR